MEAWLLAQQIEMEAIKTEVQGMIAENQYHMGLGQGIAYGEEAFQKKADELRAIAVRIWEQR